MNLPITMLEDESGLVCGEVSPGAPMKQDLREAALLQAKDALERSLEWHLCDKWRESRNLDQRDSWAHHHNMLTAALSAIEAAQGDSVHLASGTPEGVSGSDVPARPTSPAEVRDAWRGGNSYEASMLRNLLAVIHGDGGHYIEAHGLDKAIEDAESKVLDRFAASPPLPQEPSADAKRLDWLEAARRSLQPCYFRREHPRTDGSRERDVSMTFTGWSTDCDRDEYPTLREAIDAAMSPVADPRQAQMGETK